MSCEPTWCKRLEECLMCYFPEFSNESTVDSCVMRLYWFGRGVRQRRIQHIFKCDGFVICSLDYTHYIPQVCLSFKFPVSVGHSGDSWNIWRAREKQQTCFSLWTLLLTLDRKQPPGLNLPSLCLDPPFSFSDFGDTGVSSVL